MTTCWRCRVSGSMPGCTQCTKTVQRVIYQIDSEDKGDTGLAATDIQRVWRGIIARSRFHSLLAQNNAFQEANLNAGYHCDTEELNYLHPFWKKASEECTREGATKISFNTSAFVRDETDKDLRENTDFFERGDKPLCSVVKLVEAAVGKKPIWPIVAHINDKFKVTAMDLIIEEILETLEEGKNYHFNNCSSLRLRSTPGSINVIKSSYVLFRYITGLPPLDFPSPPPPPMPKDNRIKLADAKKELNRLLEESKMKGKTSYGKSTPSNLVRQASRSVYCSQK